MKASPTNGIVKASPHSKTKTMTALALLSSGQIPLTTFQAKVYHALVKVPEGKVTTYKELGLAIDCRSAHAIGQALKRNPYAPTVPCHRVVQSDLSLGGFGGTRSGAKIDRKIALLQSEGVRLNGNGCIEKSSVYTFPKKPQ
jgi:methylated-DNA-[protein]-cysteine S-methyltransferase